MMLKSPTVAELACFLRGVDANAPLHSVVVLGEVRGGAPVILLPGIGGQLLDLQDLSHHLSADHRVLGVQYPAEGKDAARIEDLARRVERDLDGETELSGAVLVGHSFGAHVAIELARRLEASGIRPWAVIVLDAAPPGGPWTRFCPSRAALVDLAVWTLLGKRDEAVWPASSTNADMDKLQGEATALLKSEGRVPNDTDGAAFGRGLDVIAARAASLATYVPAGPIEADIHLFKVAEPVAEDDDWNWAPHTLGTFRRQTPPGGHFDMIKGDNASVLADLIRKAAPATVDDWTGRTT
jgi:thioesterase domain-containing protein